MNSKGRPDIGSGSPPAVAAPTSSTTLKLAWCLIAAILLLAIFLYFYIAKISSTGDVRYVVTIVDRMNIFGVDDVYRYFFARSAWLDQHLYSWGYILPLGLVMDGSLASLFSGNMLGMRCAHILCISMPALFLIYKAGRHLGARPIVMALSVVMLAFMPLYAFVTMSFLGEAWLILLVCLTLYFFSKEEYLACAVAASLMPLVRPEGLFFLVPLAVFFYRRKNLKCFFLLFAPGFLYLLYLRSQYATLNEYLSWRLILRQILNVATTDPQAYYPLGVFSTFNPVWTVPAVAWLLSPQLRRLWPVWSGAALWLAWYVLSVWLHLATYEPRYLVSLAPVLIVSWALLVSRLLEYPFFAKTRGGVVSLVVVVTVLVLADQILQVDPLRAQFGGGQHWPVKGLAPNSYAFVTYGKERLESRRKAVDALYRVLDHDASIDTLLFYDPELLLSIDPHRLPSHVKIGLVQVPWQIALQAFKGGFFTINPGGYQYEYYYFKSQLEPGKPTALYVGELGCRGCTPIYTNNIFQVYRFTYVKSLELLTEAQLK